MLQKPLFLLLALVALVLLGAAGCDRTDKSVNSAPAVSGDDNPIHDPPEFSGEVRDTLIDYTEEAKAFGLIREPGVAYRLHPDNRLAFVGEAVLALTGWDWKVTKAIDGWAVSDWDYINDDRNAYNVVKNWYSPKNKDGYYTSCNSSMWKGPHNTDPSCATKSVGYNCFYHYPENYGFANQVGHMGQCVFGTNLLGYRSSVFQFRLPSYATTYADYYKDSKGTPGPRRYTKPPSRARVGDIPRTFRADGHTAGVIVKIMSGVAGVSVTSIDVIDANFVGGGNNEIIGRHIIPSIPAKEEGDGTIHDLDSYYIIDLEAMLDYFGT